MKALKRSGTMVLTALIGGALLLGGCNTSPQQAGKKAVKKTHQVTKMATKKAKHKVYSAAVRSGAKLYVTYACVKCHGPNGTDGVANPVLKTNIPPLNHTNLKGSQITTILENGIILTNGQDTGVINMPSWNGILKPKQMRDLAAYIEAGTPDLKVKMLPDSTGPEIYKAYACIKCHGKYGVGGVVNVGAPRGHGDHYVPTLSAANYAKKPGKYREKLMMGSIIHDGYPQGAPKTLLMPAWGRVLSSSQLTTLLNYLKTGH